MINITTIIYDENLKELLRIARNKLNPKDFKVEAYIKEIDNNDFYFFTNRMVDAQETLREIFKQNKSTLNFILTDNTDKKNYTKPNYYAFCAAFISDFEKFKSWDDIICDRDDLELKEFGYIEDNKSDKKQVLITETNRIPISGKIECKCCCSHNIKNLDFMFSKSTGYSMITGNCCIEKFFIKNPKIIKELNTIEKKRKEEKKNRTKALNSKVNFKKYKG
jgi:hypothetical protein